MYAHSLSFPGLGMQLVLCMTHKLRLNLTFFYYLRYYVLVYYLKCTNCISFNQEGYATTCTYLLN